MNKFLAAAEKVKKNFKKSYSDQWTDPATNLNGNIKVSKAKILLQSKDDIDE